MSKRFTTNGYKIYDTFHDGVHWLVNTVEAEEVVGVMNNLDSKARERSKALSKLQKKNEQLKQDALYWGQNAEARRKEIDRLREDNDILKKQRDYLFEVIDLVLPHSGSTTVYNRMKDMGDV